MYNIARIEELRASAEAVLKEQDQQLATKPESLFRRGLVQSSRAHLDELTRQLVQEKQKREFEIIEIRLVGEAAYYGSLPMQIVSHLTEAFEDMLVQVGRFIRHGAEAKTKETIQEVRDLLGARLSRLASGSTRLFVTVQTSPDLFGNSLSESCLKRTFDLLTIDKPEEVTERVAAYGRLGIRSVSRFLKTLNEAQLEAFVNWQTPTDLEIQWDGTTERIIQLQTTLANVTESESKEISFEGEILMESIQGAGRFSVRNSSGLVFTGSVPKAVMPALLALHVGEACRGVVLETVVENSITGDVKCTYELKSIESTAASTQKIESGQQLTLPL